MDLCRFIPLAMKVSRIVIHSFMLSAINISGIILGFRLYRQLINQIAQQIPFSATMCILAFQIWYASIRYLKCRDFFLQKTSEFTGVYIAAFLWSPLMFIPLHNIRWGYQTHINDIFAIWSFQIPVNLLTLFLTKHLTHFKRQVATNTFKLHPKHQRIALNNVVLAGASFLFALLGAECLLQLFYEPPSVISGWKSTVPESEKNQLGFRGHKIEYSDDEPVILLLGDSQVEAVACSYEWMPERRLQYHLKALGKQAKVISVGAGGYGQDQQLLALQEYYQTYRADIVVLWQVPTNDIWNNMFPTHWPDNGTPKPTFWLENGDLKGPSEELGESISPFSSIKLLALWQRLLMSSDRDGKWEQYFPPAYEPMTEYGGPVHKQWQELWDRNFALKRSENLDNEKSHYAMLLTPRSQRMEYGIALTRKLLQKISQLIRTHNGQFLLFKKESPQDNKWLDGVYVLNEKYYAISQAQFESNISEVNRGFQFYNLPITLEHWRVGPEDGHLNEHAVDQLMQVLAKTLERFLPERSSEAQ